jgi:hypothetical protein
MILFAGSWELGAERREEGGGRREEGAGFMERAST